MIEVTDTLKRKNNRYHTVVIKPTETVQPPQLNIRVFRYNSTDGVYRTDPHWGPLEVEGVLKANQTYEFRIALKNIPDGVINYELGLVKEGQRWVYTTWIEC